MQDYGSTSPAQNSDIFSDEMDGVSIRDRALLNRTVAKYNNNNFKAGYMPVENTKPQMRVRKTFAFWTLLILLFLLVIGNLLLTVTIIGVLKLGQGNIELVPERETIKLFGEIDLDHIYKRDGKIEGYEDQPVEITANDSPILLNIVEYGKVRTKVRIDPAEMIIKGTNNFDFDLKTEDKETIFSTNNPEFRNVKQAKHLKSKYIYTNKIRSPLDENLEVKGELLHLKGAEGTHIEGKEIVWYADQDIFLNSTNGSVVLSGKDGVFISQRVPKANIHPKNYVTSQFKVCVCMPEGKLFRIPVLNLNEPIRCDHINMSPDHNPCM